MQVGNKMLMAYIRNNGNPHTSVNIDTILNAIISYINFLWRTLYHKEEYLCYNLLTIKIREPTREYNNNIKIFAHRKKLKIHRERNKNIIKGSDVDHGFICHLHTTENNVEQLYLCRVE